jgi:hypothetical protein
MSIACSLTPTRSPPAEPLVVRLIAELRRVLGESDAPAHDHVV